MKAAFISDVHIGPTGYHKGVRRKLTEHSEEYVVNFVRRVSSTSEYSFAIHLGDLIQDDVRETDIANYQKGVELFSHCRIPFHHIVGNHDTIHMSAKEVAGHLGYDSLYYSFDAEDIHVVLMHSLVTTPKIPGITVPQQQLTWLRSDLSETSLPTIIFIHHSLADQTLIGNPWFENKPKDCLVENRNEVRQIIAGSNKVIAIINGHLHWNQITMHDNIPYITVQSATENFANDGVPANSWGEVEVKDGKFKLRVFGNDEFEFEYVFDTLDNQAILPSADRAGKFLTFSRNRK